MRFIDSNIIIRYITGDNPVMATNTKNLFQRVIGGTEAVMTSEGVIHEVCAVLASPRLYNMTHKEIRDRLRALFVLPGFSIPDKDVCLVALDIYGDNQSLDDYVDAIGIARVRNGSCDGIYSYDRGISKVLGGINRLEPA